MEIVSRKSEIQSIWNICKQKFDPVNIKSFVDIIYHQILMRKVKFPLLEYCAEELHTLLPTDSQILFCDGIQSKKTEGGNVIIGKMLQLRLPSHFLQSIQKAAEYISKTHIWYTCDIIGERVYGVALLKYPDAMLPEFKQLSSYPSNWVVRSLGAGAHYAIKKGLKKMEVRAVFEILLSMANTKDKEVKQGVGWAAKTVAKFHPEIINEFQKKIQNEENVASWFRSKVQIGLNRNTYAKRN